MRFVLVLQYLRACLLPDARALASEHALGIAVAASMWLASALAPVPARYLLWGLALTTDLVTIVIVARHTETSPPDAAHLPERFGLFTLILFGESIVAVMKGIQAQPSWTVSAASAAFLGIGVIFAFWWGYFEVASAAAERHIRRRADARRFHVWSYAHLPFYLGLALTTTGIEHIVRAGGTAHLGVEAAAILGGGATVSTVALAVLRETAGARRLSSAKVRPYG